MQILNQIIDEIDRRMASLRNQDSDFHQGNIAGLLQAKLIIRRAVTSAEYEDPAKVKELVCDLVNQIGGVHD